MGWKLKVQEIRNPTATGWRWAGENGTEHEVAWTDGGGWLYGVQAVDGRWQVTTAPGIRPARSISQARLIAREFILNGYDDPAVDDLVVDDNVDEGEHGYPDPDASGPFDER